jgi:sugar phosphate isomerase/epimerase
MTAVPEFFVNLPLRYIHSNPEYLDIFISRRINPELGLDCLDGECLNRDWLETIKKRISDAGLSCTVHLPFLDLKPGSLNRAIRLATIEIMKSAMDVAAMYSPLRMVMHPSLTSWLEPDLFQRTADYCCETISSISDYWPGHPDLCLENTHEISPEIITGMVKDINRSNVGICFDIGHWHSFSKGYKNNDFDFWFDTFLPYLRHLHLHDNNGNADSHFAIGQGSIDWDHVVQRLKQITTAPTYTLEPHSQVDFEESIKYFKSRILPNI